MPECRICERTVRQYVHDRKLELGQVVHETFVPQSYDVGHRSASGLVRRLRGSVRTTNEAAGVLDAQHGERRGISLRVSACHATGVSGSARAGLRFFCGVFRKLRYDNLTSAVKKILRGYRREETARFIAFRSHWRFESEFCTPGEAHEKGGMEGEVGYFRRNHWVPVPSAADLARSEPAVARGLPCR